MCQQSHSKSFPRLTFNNIQMKAWMVSRLTGRSITTTILLTCLALTRSKWGRWWDRHGIVKVKMWSCRQRSFFFQGTINNLEKNPATVGRGVKVRPVPIDIMTIMINQPIHPSKNTHKKKAISVPINIMITNVLLRNQYQDCELPGEWPFVF